MRQMKTYRILNLGAGVQSSTLALMGLKNWEYWHCSEPLPYPPVGLIDFAIFADTQEERAAAPAAGPEAELARVLLGIGHELAQALDRQILAHHQDQRSGGDLGDRRERGEVEGIVRVKRLRDQGAGRDEEQRVPVGRSTGELAQRRDEIAAGLVLNQNRGVQAFAHLLRHHARHHVGRAAGRKPDQHADRPARQVLRGRYRCMQPQERRAGEDA